MPVFEVFVLGAGGVVVLLGAGAGVVLLLGPGAEDADLLGAGLAVEGFLVPLALGFFLLPFVFAAAAVVLAADAPAEEVVGVAVPCELPDFGSVGAAVSVTEGTPSAIKLEPVAELAPTA